MGVVFAKIGRSEIIPYVELAFSGDDKLLRQYHISPGTLSHCVTNTLDFINQNADYYQEDMQFFVVLNDGEPIGYTIVIKNETPPNELYSFGINIKYRTEEIKKAWLKEIGRWIEGDYRVSLWSKNERAVHFFEKNGFKVNRVSKYLNDEIKTLIKCQQGDR